MEATVIGLVTETLILIAIKEEPHIALNIIKRNKLFAKILLIRKSIFCF